MGNSRLLVDSGSSINIIKNQNIPNHLQKIAKVKKFLMGHDQHTSTHEIIIPYLGVHHTFHVVDEDFPVPEDGIMGLPFLHKYRYNLTNDVLYLNKKRHDLIDDGIIIPPHSVQLVTFPAKFTNNNAVLLNNELLPDSIYKIVDQTIKIPLSNPTNEYKTYQTHEFDIRPTQIEFQEAPVMYITEQELLNRTMKVLECSRLNHLEDKTKESIVKIISGYHDIYTLEGDPLPCTNLTSHKIVLKEEKTINIKSYRPPECHKNEIHSQMTDQLTKGIIKDSDSPFNSPIWVVPKKNRCLRQKKVAYSH